MAAKKSTGIKPATVNLGAAMLGHWKAGHPAAAKEILGRSLPVLGPTPPGYLRLIVAHVLGVAAFEVGDPVAEVVLMVGDDPTRHAVI